MRELENANQKIKELRHKLMSLERKWSDEQKNLELLELLQAKLAKIHKEKVYYEMRDVDNCHMIAELKYTVSALKDAVINSKIHCENQEGSHQQAIKEVHRLKKELSMKSMKSPTVNFREFVNLKREAASLKLENEELKMALSQKTM